MQSTLPKSFITVKKIPLRPQKASPCLTRHLELQNKSNITLSALGFSSMEFFFYSSKTFLEARKNYFKNLSHHHNVKWRGRAGGTSLHASSGAHNQGVN